jgi:hypothetical protein
MRFAWDMVVSSEFLVLRLCEERSDEAIHVYCGNGLLRGVYHRARIRATRWLAMTILI